MLTGGACVARTGPRSPASPTSSDDLDAALVGRLAAAGDTDSLASLYDRHAAVALGFLTRMLGESGEAEEVLQDVFVQVWREAGRYCPERASVRGWLLMLARSRALDRIRSTRARVRREEALAVESRGGAVAPSGSERLERSERHRSVRAALERLSLEHRQAVELAFFEGLSHSQIAARLGAPLGTVKSRILYGMRRLRTVLEATGPAA